MIGLGYPCKGLLKPCYYDGQPASAVSWIVVAVAVHVLLPCGYRLSTNLYLHHGNGGHVR